MFIDYGYDSQASARCFRCAECGAHIMESSALLPDVVRKRHAEWHRLGCPNGSQMDRLQAGEIDPAAFPACEFDGGVLPRIIKHIPLYSDDVFSDDLDTPKTYGFVEPSPSEEFGFNDASLLTDASLVRAVSGIPEFAQA